MKRKCIMCGREFEANTSGTLCSAECRLKRRKGYRRQFFANKAEHYRKYWREKQREYRREKREAYQEAARKYYAGKFYDYGAMLAAELAYWNYLIEKYPGGAA
mgnify:CR=1 FL=1